MAAPTVVAPPLLPPDAETRRRENRRVGRRRAATGHLVRLPLYLLGLTTLAP